jgi:FMN phosphatase YigB (HAD superfamily)
MGIDCIVLDFDGTFTDVERESRPFLEHYRAGLAGRLGGLESRWEVAKRSVLEHPDEHGFRFEGRIVAPSHADPFILATSIAHVLLEGDTSIDEDERDGLLERLFRDAYASCDTVFRPEAEATLRAVRAHGAPVVVVTNSHTDHVRAKLARLPGGEGLEVVGNARKFNLVDPDPTDARFEALDETLRVEGLARPVYLRRGHYYAILRDVWERTGARAETTLVVGDIFELDLAMPGRLGARIHLVSRERTPDYELRAVRDLGGTHSPDLGALTAVLDELAA